MKKYIAPKAKVRAMKFSHAILFVSKPVNEIGFDEDAANTGGFDSGSLPSSKSVWE